MKYVLMMFYFYLKMKRTTKAKMGNEGWSQVQESINSLQKMHLESFDSKIK